MVKHLLLFIIFLAAISARSQYTPITVVGFNHDVIAESSTATSSLATTTKEMDAITPSNFVICTEEFAIANSIPAGYGLPTTGSIVSGTKSYQLAPLGNGTATFNNVLYLLRGDVGTLTLLTPSTFNSLSFLCTATEGAATVDATVQYTDGTNQVFTLNILDWVGTSTSILSGFGRIKRIAGPFPVGTYEMGGVNPKLYSNEVTVNCSKLVSSVDFTNTSAGSGTASNRAFIFAISGAAAALPISPVLATTNDTICSGQTKILTIQSPDPLLSYSWFNAATGGIPIAIGTSFTTPALSATTTYYVQSANGGGCASARTADTITVLPAPPAAILTAAQVCTGQTATLIVTNATTGITYSWYTNALGGTSFFTGDTYTTPPLSSNVTYYVEASTALGCKSMSRTPVTVSIAPPPAAPAATAAPVCPGQTATINITSPNSTLTYTYYTVATSGTAVATGTSYTTPPVTTAITYYIESSNAGGCISVTRTPVTVNLAPQPAAPAATVADVCSGQAATINITNPNATITYSYYTIATGGTALASGTSYTTPPVTTSVTYYIEASNAGGCISATRTPVTVNILPALAAPAATVADVCLGQVAIINITNPAASIIYSYYPVATGGAAIATGTSFATPPVTTSVTYYIEASNSGGCISATRTAITVNIVPAPAAPAATVAIVCSGQTATINITNPDPALVYSYYSGASGGTAVGTGISYTTPPVTGSVTYYVEASNSTGCTSSTRTPVLVNFTSLPAAPAATAAPVCAGQTATIFITNPDPALTYNYYITATIGTPSGTGTSYTTPPVTGSVTYYISAVTTGGCSSATRTPVTITVAPARLHPSRRQLRYAPDKPLLLPSQILTRH